MGLPPPVGKRPMLSAADLNRVVEMRRMPDYDRTSPDLRDLFQCIGQYRDWEIRIYRKTEKRGGGHMSVYAGARPTPHGVLFCVSASYPNHYPTWDEMKRVRETFIPMSKPAMMVFPDSKTPYINDHPYMLWVWEMPFETWGWPPEEPRELQTAEG